MSHFERVVLLVDMDCFYCQVEENLNPAIKGKPIAVVQYNAWRGGGIIAVNYPARDRGVTRHMRGNEAKAKCPEIELVQVPNVRGKADLSKFRDAGKRVAEVLQTFTTLLERASVDEAYLDITEAVKKRLNEKVEADSLKTTHVVGYENVGDFLDDISDSNLCDESNRKLGVGALIAEEIRAAVFEKTGYRCSAGVAHNKILAKLVCGLHKPNQQTVLPQQNVAILYENLPVRKIKSLGGKFGSQLAEKLEIQNMGELYRFSEKELSRHFEEKTANWLYKIARGIDVEPVTVRLISKSIGCCKKFPGRTALVNPKDIKHWLGELCLEISERLEKDKEENNRKAKQMVVSFVQDSDGRETSSSRTHPLNSYEAEKIAADAFEVLRKNCTGSFCIKFLGINISKFEDLKHVNTLNALFKNMINNNAKSREANNVEVQNNKEKENSETSIGNREVKACDDSLNNALGSVVCTKEDISDDSNDSISQEINNKVDTTNLNSATSFFKQYLVNNQNNDRSRDFNTSLGLCEGLEGDEDSSNSETSNEEIINNETISNEASNIVPSSSSCTVRDICPECKKSIAIEEMVSHMDYHFAINLVKSECSLYKPTKAVVTNSNSKPVMKQKKSIKRKISADNCTKLTAFLKKDLIDDEDASETCEQCGKRIRIDDIPDHADYHLAKKIHQEINSKNTVITKKDVKSEKITKSKSIATFFNRQ